MCCYKSGIPLSRLEFIHSNEILNHFRNNHIDVGFGCVCILFFFIVELSRWRKAHRVQWYCLLSDSQHLIYKVQKSTDAGWRTYGRVGLRIEHLERTFNFVIQSTRTYTRAMNIKMNSILEIFSPTSKNDEFPLASFAVKDVLKWLYTNKFLLLTILFTVIFTGRKSFLPSNMQCIFHSRT